MVGVLLLAVAVAFVAQLNTKIFWAASDVLDVSIRAPLAIASVVLSLSVSACFGRAKKLLANTWVRMHL